MSFLKTTLLLGLMTGLLMLIGGLIGGRHGVVIFFVIAAVMNFFSYWFSDNNPHHAAVAVTRGIMRICTREELKGVIGHELSHVINRDILTSSIAATLAGAVMMIGTMIRWGAIFGLGNRDDEEGGIAGLLVAGILAPIAATLIQLAISRTREYQADASGAKLTHNPLYLASALRKLEAANERMPLDASPATAHMFIVNPLSAAGISRLFSTHPPIEERIHRLEQMASSGQVAQG